jgi:hypothetical protein
LVRNAALPQVMSGSATVSKINCGRDLQEVNRWRGKATREHRRQARVPQLIPLAHKFEVLAFRETALSRKRQGSIRKLKFVSEHRNPPLQGS